jgi:hypothetical protein
MSYQACFGADFDLGFSMASLPVTLVDRSHHNDVCPSFYFELDARYYILYVDFCNPEQRENPDASRYTIVIAINDGDAEYPEIFPDDMEPDLFTTNDAAALVQYVTSLAKGSANKAH